MAETEDRRHQDIGTDEAQAVNLKMVVATEKDYDGRSRSYYDNGMQQLLELQAGLAKNFGATIASINSSIALGAQKQVENVLGVNATDFAERDIINSPWAEAMKTLMTQVMSEIGGKK